MLILSVDTSTRSGSVAVLEGQRLLGVVGTDADETYSSRLFRHVNFLLRELAIAVERFDLYAVVTGPGSFTGLRVGLTAVKGWAEVHGRPVAAVSGLEAVAWQCAMTGEWIAPVMDARRGQIYGGLYRRDSGGLKRVGDDVVMSAEEYLCEVADRTSGAVPVFASPQPVVIEEALRTSVLKDSKVERVAPILAPIVGRIGRLRAEQGLLIDAMALDAHYIRRSDAELLWKG